MIMLLVTIGLDEMHMNMPLCDNLTLIIIIMLYAQKRVWVVFEIPHPIQFD